MTKKRERTFLIAWPIRSRLMERKVKFYYLPEKVSVYVGSFSGYFGSVSKLSTLWEN